MAADFDEESRLANETVTRQASNPNVTVALVMAAVVALVLGLVWSTSSRKGGKPQNAGEESFATARLQPGVSFDKPPMKSEENRFFIPPPPLAAPGAAAAVVVPPPGVAVQQAPVDDSEARRLAELEKEEARREARLRSPMLVVNDREGTASVDGSAHVTAEEREEDANRKFLKNAENDVVRARATKNHRTDALVPQGFMIRGVLETGIQSDLPGNVRASVSEDVYSFDGRRVLIPKGTMLTGEYRSGVVRGQSRVLIIWTRMLRADGVSLMLGSYGTDNLGRSGLEGEVDKHFIDRFGNAALLTLTGGVAQFVASLGQNQNQPANQQYAFDPVTGQLIPIAGTQNSTLLSARQIGAQAASQAITRMAEEALKDEIHIPPTIYVDQGTRILVFVKRDLDFSDLYPDPVKEALYELKHPNKRPRRDEDPALGDPAGVLSERGGAHTGLVTKP